MFFTIMIAAILMYTTLRSQKLVPKYFIKMALFFHTITCISVYLRGSRFNSIIPHAIPYYVFIAAGPFTWICCCYSIYCIGKLIRNNPGADKRQRRLEKLSNVVVVVGGLIQLINIGLSLTPFSVFCIPMTSLTLLLFSISDILVDFNKDTFICCNEPFGASKLNL